jgi:hypothetical protein
VIWPVSMWSWGKATAAVAEVDAGKGERGQQHRHAPRPVAGKGCHGKSS